MGCLAAIVLLGRVPGGATLTTGDRRVVVVTASSYAAGPNESAEIAHALALFSATYKAADQGADHLVDAGFFNGDANRKTAVLCLVADAMTPQVLEQSMDVASRSRTVKIKSTLALDDYVKAEIRNATLDQEETHLSLKEEMEPAISPVLAPALELSRAYRYIGRGHWRMAIIYMDHLERKYPHWGALHLAKATAYFGMHEDERALSALRSACYLGVREACLKINALDPPD